MFAAKINPFYYIRVFPGHLMKTMNPRSFKSLERSGIKWKNWSYQICQHRTPSQEFLGLFSLEIKVMEGPFGWMHQKIHGCKDRERKRFWHLCFSKTLESPQNGLISFCVCVTVNQYCSVSGAITRLYSYRKKSHCLQLFTPSERTKPTKEGRSER